MFAAGCCRMQDALLYVLKMQHETSCNNSNKAFRITAVTNMDCKLA